MCLLSETSASDGDIFPAMFRKAGLGNQLLTSVEMESRRNGIHQLFILTTHSSHWFLEQGFSEASLAELPASRQDLYNLQRNSKVFTKRLG